MSLFAHLSRRATELGHRPAVTFADDATGERTELSFATLHNWVSKAANLLVGEWDVGPGDLVSIVLPLHWTLPVVSLAAWAAGATVTTDTGAPLTIGWEGTEPPPALVIGGGLGGQPADPAAAGLTLRDVLAEGDLFARDPGDRELVAFGDLIQGRLLDTGLTERLLLAGERTDATALALIARVLPAGGSLVLARGYADDALPALAEAERALLHRGA